MRMMINCLINKLPPLVLISSGSLWSAVTFDVRSNYIYGCEKIWNILYTVKNKSVGPTLKDT